MTGTSADRERGIKGGKGKPDALTLRRMYRRITTDQRHAAVKPRGGEPQLVNSRTADEQQASSTQSARENRQPQRERARRGQISPPQIPQHPRHRDRGGDRV